MDMMNMLAGLQFTFEDMEEVIKQLEENLDEIHVETDRQWETPQEALAFVALARCALANAQRVMQKSITESWDEIYSHESLPYIP